MKKYEQEIKWYKDWRFWLLVLSINISGNPGFNIILPYYATLICMFVFVLTYLLVIQKIVDKAISIYVLFWTCLFLFHGYYIDEFGFNSALHIIMKMTIGVSLLLLLKSKFVPYYLDVILFFSVVSLICFAYNHIFGVLPYANLGSNIDEGRGFRVSSIIYTQLYNLNNEGLSFRNCGPFWEPGAFQGFVNLAIMIGLLSFEEKERDEKWYIRQLIFVLTIITTFSTGGYIVLALNVIYYIVTTRKLTKTSKMVMFILFISVSIFVFFKIDFFYEKISGDEARLGTSASDFFSENLLQTIFGYGFSGESISHSNIKSASSVFNLFRYTGILGVLLYYVPLIGTKINFPRIFYTIGIFLIMMNEPFITAGVFWWCIPLLFPYIKNLDKNDESSVEN